MTVAGEKPEAGVRVTLTRPREPGSPPWIYAGSAFTPDATFGLRVVISSEGDVVVDVSDAHGAGPPVDLAEKVRLIVRTVHRQARSEGEAPPLRIARWRGPK